jgi:hypothetical protein
VITDNRQAKSHPGQPYVIQPRMINSFRASYNREMIIGPATRGSEWDLRLWRQRLLRVYANP